MNTSIVQTVLAGIVAAACAFGSSPADAATAQVLEATNASGVCQPATFTVAKVRQRPEGTRNESSGPLYMTCAATGGYNGNASGSAEIFYLTATNTGASQQTINCTFFDGVKLSGLAAYPQSLSAAAGNTIIFEWDSVDLNGGTKWEAGSFSCLLQPGVEINTIYMGRHQEIGT